jgi:crotonobetaine/carnitine-CoA ligase
MTQVNALHPFVGMDVMTLLERRVATRGDHPYLIWDPPGETGPRTWTYAEFADEVAAVAAGLAARGVKAGDRILIHLVNCPEFMFAWFACARLGAVAVTTNTRSAGDELSYYAADCEAVGAITQPAHSALVDSCAPDLRWLVCTTHDGGLEPDSGRLPDRASSFDSLRDDPGSAPRIAVDPLAPMSVQYTSGTTSKPKGVLWTQANALWGGQVSSAIEGLRPDDVHYVCNPLFHTNALSYSMLASMWTGSSMVLVPKWSTSRFWEVSLRHGCTYICIIAFTYRAIIGLEVPAGSRYRLMALGVCDLPTDAQLGVKTLGWWGMTETVSLPIAGDPHLPNTPMSLGRPVPQYEIAVVHEDGSPIAPGETGTLLVKGVQGVSLFAEYLNQPEATASSFDERGWFDSGDLVTLLPDGHLVFEGRAKDMLKVGGENVAASEVERVIEGVGGVEEAAVVGQPHDMLDEVPVAFVIAPAGGDIVGAIVKACEESLADFKVPRAVYLVDDLPRAGLGKVNKVLLREDAAARLQRPTTTTG